MSKLSLICLFLLTICILSNLSSAESNRNDSESVKFDEHRIQKRIVGGWFTEQHQDTVFRLNFGPNSCTGTFIAPNAILTAAHCCVIVKPSIVIVYLPPYYDRTFNVTVLKYHFHPEYNGSANHDIAIIELVLGIYHFNGYDRRVIPATLDYSEVECGETVWLFGYGRTEVKQVLGTFQLKQFRAEVVQCLWYVSYFPQLFQGDVIYTYGTSGSTCKGDSGGPMFNHKGIIGVHSRGNCSKGQLNIAVRISSHKNFIQSALHQIPSSASKLTLYFKSLSFFILITFYYIF